MFDENLHYFRFACSCVLGVFLIIFSFYINIVVLNSISRFKFKKKKIVNEILYLKMRINQNVGDVQKSN